MSDKSASLREATEQLAELKRQLGESRAAAEAASAKATAATAELEQSHSRAMGLATSLAELEGELEGRRAEAAAQEEALAAARAEVEAARAQAEAQRGEAEAARQALAAVQQGSLLEKEQQVSKGVSACGYLFATYPKPCHTDCRRSHLPNHDPTCAPSLPCLPASLPARSSWAARSCRSFVPSWESRRRRRPSCAPSWRRGTASCGRPRPPWRLRWPRRRSRWAGGVWGLECLLVPDCVGVCLASASVPSATQLPACLGLSSPQVQQLLAANGRVHVLEAELAAVRGELEAAHQLQPGTVAEAVAAARADARRELDRLEQLLEQVRGPRAGGGSQQLPGCVAFWERAQHKLKLMPACYGFV